MQKKIKEILTASKRLEIFKKQFNKFYVDLIPLQSPNYIDYEKRCDVEYSLKHIKSYLNSIESEICSAEKEILKEKEKYKEYLHLYERKNKS